MAAVSNTPWNTLEQWSPHLFVLAAVFLLVGALNSGVAFLSEAHTFNEWAGIVLELGRLAALLGTAGLSVQLVRRNATLGTLSRVVASLAVIFVAGLIAFATLNLVGVLTGSSGLLGICAYVLSVSTFFVAGVGTIRTGVHSSRIGGLLLVNVVALLVVFFGRLVVPLGLLAAVVPGIQVLFYFGIGYDLRSQKVATRRTTPATDTAQ